MTEKNYWKRRAELAELVITGFQGLDITLPDGFVDGRLKPWVNFIKNNKPVSDNYMEGELFERKWVDPGGVSVMKIPGGQFIMEYWDAAPNFRVGENNEITSAGTKGVITSAVLFKP